MASLSTIRTTIKNKLTTLLNNKARVYAYYESNPQQYPVVIFDIASQQNEFITNLENMSAITFKLILLIDQADANASSGLTEQEATDKLDELVDLIVSSLETDFSLGGVVDYCTPTVGNRETIAIANGIGKAQYINLVVRQSVFVA